MHILLTDLLTCPRCGPTFGLILLAERMEDRRVYEGRLGCANCREKYEVRGGVGVFGDPARPAASVDPARVERQAALLGVTSGPANVLLAGPSAAGAGALADLIEGLEVLAVQVADSGAHQATVSPGGDEPVRAEVERAGVSRLTVAGRLPLTSGRLAGVLLDGAASDALLEEGARVASPTGRLVLEDAPADAAERLAAAGRRILVQEGSTVVAVRA